MPSGGQYFKNENINDVIVISRKNNTQLLTFYVKHNGKTVATFQCSRESLWKLLKCQIKWQTIPTVERNQELMKINISTIEGKKQMMKNVIRKSYAQNNFIKSLN